MSDTSTTEQEPITVKVSAQNPRTPRQPSATGNKAIPAGPALLAGANMATIAGATLFAAAGPVGLAAGAATVAAAGAATMLGRQARAAKQQRIANRASGTSSTNGGKGKTAGGAAGASPRGTGAARSGGLPNLGLGRKTGTGSSPNGKTPATGSKPGAGRHAASGPGRGLRGLLGKPTTSGSAGRQAKANRIADRLTNPTTRAGRALSRAADGVKRAVRNNHTKPRTSGASGGTGGGKKSKGTPLLSRPGWGIPHTAKKARKAWRKWRRKPVDSNKKTSGEPTGQIDNSKPKTVGTQVRGATTNATKTTAAAPDPVNRNRTATPNGTNPATAGDTMTATPIQHMQACADEILKIATKMDSVATMEVLRWYSEWPEVLRTLDKAWRVMHDKAAENYPFNPAIIELIDAVARNQAATTKAAEVIHPTANRLHRDDIADLYDAKKAMWDQSANKEHI